MRTSKRWTNATFTKRVDHEAGQHRPPRHAAGPAECARCHAVYVKGRWNNPGTARVAAIRAVAEPAETLCPACRMRAEGQFGGELRLSGQFVASHGSELVRLIRNEADRAKEDNPTAQILELTQPAADRLIARTSTEHLAQRLGHAVHKAHGGAVHFEFSHENKFAHVTWTRDE